MVRPSSSFTKILVESMYRPLDQPFATMLTLEIGLWYQFSKNSNEFVAVSVLALKFAVVFHI